MFIFEFYQRLHWYYKRTSKNQASILWKITISGPFVTLYSENDYYLIVKNSNYSIIYPGFVEHIHAHGENIIESFYPSSLRDTHTHIVLPCRKKIVSEIRDLLELIEKHNTPDNKLIDCDFIVGCLEAYECYLNNSSLDEHKKNVNYLLIRWIGPKVNNEIMPFFLAQNQMNTINPSPSKDIKAPETEKIGLAIIKFLDHPNESTFELLRKEAFNFFASLKYFPHLETERINQLMELMPKSSTDRFNQIFYDHPIFSYGGLFVSAILIIKICSILTPNELILLIAAGMILYGPTLAEKVHTLMTAVVVEDDQNFNNLKLAEIRSKYSQLLMFPSMNANKPDITENHMRLSNRV